MLPAAHWLEPVGLLEPYWHDYLPFLRVLKGSGFPGCDQLNALLPRGLASDAGQPIQFVPSSELTDAAYEQRIFTTGKVSTRPDNWHDLFNALVWARFPTIKTAMNALHHDAFSDPSCGTRGALRDALTLFDECGVIVFSDNPATLRALSERRWQEVFHRGKPRWGKDIQVAVTGHAMLEKFLTPYKSMTAKALLVQVEMKFQELPRNEQLAFLDQALAGGMLRGDLLTTPATLTPLPLAGIPGWWSLDPQDEHFYDDERVFRPAPANLTPVPMIRLA